MLIQRRLLGSLLELLKTEGLILVEGPPRCGLSTFAAQIAKAAPGAILVHAGTELGRNVLAAPALALGALPSSVAAGARPSHGPRLLVADEAGPEEARAAAAALASGAAGERTRMVLVGRGFPDGLPAARLALGPLSLGEVGAGSRTRHWLRGGFPEAFAAPSDQAAAEWLGRYAASVSEERFAAAGLPWAPGRSARLLAMVAEAQGGGLNESAAARSLGLSRPTVARALASLVRAGLARELPAIGRPRAGRVARAPALYLRDSGLYNALMGLAGFDRLLGSARLAASWEGYAIEQALALLPPGIEAARATSRDGNALELVLSRGGGAIAAASIRWARRGGPGRAAAAAADELEIPLRWLVLPESEEADAGAGFRALGLSRFLELVAEL